VGESVDPKSISHEHTFDDDTGDAERLQSTLMRLSEMVGRRCAEGRIFCAHPPAEIALHRFHDHHASANSLEQPTQMLTRFLSRRGVCFSNNGNRVHRCAIAGSASVEFRIGLTAALFAGASRDQRWQKPLAAADHLRDKFGEAAIGLARDEGRIPRAHARKSGGPARQECPGKERPGEDRPKAESPKDSE